MYKIYAELNSKEMYNLRCVLGEFKRIARDQYFRYVATEKKFSDSLYNKEIFDISESLITKLVEGFNK